MWIRGGEEEDERAGCCDGGACDDALSDAGGADEAGRACEVVEEEAVCADGLAPDVLSECAGARLAVDGDGWEGGGRERES